MEKCKFCEAELEEGTMICPACGKEQEEPVCEEACCECNEENSCECGEECCCECVEQPKPRMKPWKVGLLILAGVVLLGILTGAVLYGLGIDLRPRANDVYFKDNYTVEDSALEEKGNLVIATVGDEELSNAQLQIYYWTHALDFLDYYGSYGIIDTSKGLHEQTWDEDTSYQQFFLDMALDAWQETQALCALAEENSYVMAEDLQAELDALPEGLKEMLGTDYESVEEMLRDQLFPGITEEGYLKYVRDYYYGYSYLETLESGFAPTAEQVEAYFDEHEEGYAENGVTKQSISADVRHILLAPEGDTDEDWAACLTSAEDLLEEWKNGAATEESFAQLANTHSVDGGSNTNGGLYTDITPTTNFVPNFLNWTIDPERKVGDTDIVQSDYGYHIMYYVGGDVVETEWREIVEEDYITEKVQAAIAGATERLPMKVNYKDIVLGYVSLSGE